MTRKTKKISRNQERAIIALLSEPSITKAARAANIGDKTLRRWLDSEAFSRAYHAARKAVTRQATARIQAAMSKAVETLKTIMTDDQKPASSRVAAARTILDYGLKFSELEDIESRLSALESQMDKRK
jgi:hypothetical protein